MAIYVSTGENAWRSSGRGFAIAGALALLVTLSSFYLSHRQTAPGHSPDTQFFLFVVEVIGAGLFVLMALVTWGAFSMAREERGDIEVRPDGVHRMLGASRGEFVALQEIAGFVTSATGVTLVDRSGERRMTISRNLEDYRGCMAELHAMGIRALPPGSIVHGDGAAWSRMMRIGHVPYVLLTTVLFMLGSLVIRQLLDVFVGVLRWGAFFKIVLSRDAFFSVLVSGLVFAEWNWWRAKWRAKRAARSQTT